MVTYVLVFLLMANPYSFGVSRVRDYLPFIFLIFFSTFIIPMIVVLMMRGLNLVESMELKTRNERIAPYVASGIFYGWLFINLKNNADIPWVFQAFVLGATASLTLTFIINLFYKISAHAVGTGGMIMGLILLSRTETYRIFYLPWIGNETLQLPALYAILGAVLIAGLVGTGRLYLKAHTLEEWLTGIFVGFVGQWFAFGYYGNLL